MYKIEKKKNQVKIVLDTNVILGSILGRKTGANRKVMNTIDQCISIPILSQPIEDEYRAVLRIAEEKKGLVPHQAGDIIIDHLKSRCIWVSPQENASAFVSDLSDSMFVEAAEEGKAEYIVTINKRHYNFQSIQMFKGIIVCKPGEYLNDIGL